MKRSALLFAIAVCFSASVCAQGAGAYAQRGGSSHFSGPGPRFAGPGFWRHGQAEITGAPYSATVTEQFTEALANGTTISRTSTGQIARDSSGRTYSQTTVNGGAFFDSRSGSRTIIFITDPVAGYSYVLNPSKKVAIRRPFQDTGVPPHPQNRGHEGNANVTVTDLGTQTDASSGLEMQGKRVTRTIPAGAIGNSQAIVSTTETWYSPALQIVIRSTRSDPRFGQSTYALTNISQNEPSASLFAIPAGYTVQDAPLWRGGSPQQ
jgi:hypothetical protein